MALAFDGSNQFIRYPRETYSFANGEHIFHSVWVYFNSTASNMDLLTKADAFAAATNYGFRALSGGKIHFQYRNSTNTGWHLFTSTNVVFTTDQWHHLAFKYTYGTGSSAHMFVDGAEIAATWTLGSGNEAPFAQVHFTIFGIAGDTLKVNDFDGKAGEMALWNDYIPTDAEIVALAKGDSPAKHAFSKMKLFDTMWGLGASSYDLSGNAMHGAIIGGATLDSDHAPVGLYMPQQRFRRPIINSFVQPNRFAVDADILTRGADAELRGRTVDAEMFV